MARDEQQRPVTISATRRDGYARWPVSAALPQARRSLVLIRRGSPAAAKLVSRALSARLTRGLCAAFVALNVTRGV